MKKYSSTLALIMVVLTLLISKFPNENRLVYVDASKAILGLAFGILSVVFIILSIFSTKNNLKVNNDAEIKNARSIFVKNKIIRIFFTIISLGLFITTIILTNDTVKEKIDTEKLLPIFVIASMILVCVILIWGRKQIKQ